MLFILIGIEGVLSFQSKGP